MEGNVEVAFRNMSTKNHVVMCCRSAAFSLVLLGPLLAGFMGCSGGGNPPQTPQSYDELQSMEAEIEMPELPPSE